MKVESLKLLVAYLFLVVLFFTPIKNVSAAWTTGLNVSCNCGTKPFGACGTLFASDSPVYNSKLRGSCDVAPTGPDTCNARNGSGSNATFWEYRSCTAPSVTPIVTPSVTPIVSPSVTPPVASPTPPGNPLCVCNAANACSTQCNSAFSKHTTGVTYANPIKCTGPATLFQSVPTATQKNDWCRRANRTKGDANGDNSVTLLDYFYYISAKVGAKIPATINPDFNGDGQVNASDRVVIIKSL